MPRSVYAIRVSLKQDERGGVDGPGDSRYIIQGCIPLNRHQGTLIHLDRWLRSVAVYPSRLRSCRLPRSGKVIAVLLNRRVNEIGCVHNPPLSFTKPLSLFLLR